MKVELLVSEWCAPCHQAEKVWREVAQERDFDFSVVDMGQPEGKELVRRLRIRTIPALVVDGALKAIGVQSYDEAREIVAAAPSRATAATRHAGLSLAPTGRFAVHSSMVYLLLAGGLLAVHGTLLAGGPARAAGLHLFTLGFLVFMIYGLAEHMLSRFTGNPIRMGPLAWLQLVLAHLGVIGFVSGLWLALPVLTLAGMVLAWTALLLFSARIWPVLWP